MSNGKGGATHGATYTNEEVARMMAELAKGRTAQTAEITKVVTAESTSIKDLLKKAGETAEKHWKEDYLDGVTLGMNHTSKVVADVARPINSKLDLLVHRSKSTVGDFVIGLISGGVAGVVGFNIMKSQNETNFGGMMLVGAACLVGVFALVMLLASCIRGLSRLEDGATEASEQATARQQTAPPQVPTATAAPVSTPATAAPAPAAKAPKKDDPKEPAKAEVDEDETDDGSAQKESRSA